MLTLASSVTLASRPECARTSSLQKTGRENATHIVIHSKVLFKYVVLVQK